MRFVFSIIMQCLLLLAADAGMTALGATRGSSSIDLGDIPMRPATPRLLFDRFFQIRNISNLQFSPDNRTLYFIRSDGRVKNVFALDLGTRALRQITQYNEPVRRFLVAHRGTFLITLQDIDGNESFNLYQFDLSNGNILKLTDSTNDDRSLPCDLSPDDRFLYFMQTRNGRSESDLLRLDFKSRHVKIVLPAQGRLLECGKVSADGRYLIFREFVDNNEAHLGLVDLATGKARYILRRPGVNNLDAGFSGDRIYFLNAMAADGLRLWQYRIGAPFPNLTDFPIPRYIDSLSLQVQGDIAVIRYRDGVSSDLAIFTDHFQRNIEMTLPGEKITGAVFSESDPQTAVIMTANADQPHRFYMVDQHSPILLYDSNQSGIDNNFFTRARSVRVASFDGLQIPVHLFIPNGTSTTTKRPVIFWIHGGPEQHIDPEYINKIQFLANQGYIVVAPNVRGSTGFGKCYALLDNNDWGGGHVRDIVEVATFVSALDFVDGDNLFILGESFGGFSVLSLITQYPKVFRAAISISGMTDLASFVDSWPDYVVRNVLHEIGFDPRVDTRRNYITSPLYHVKNIRIPLQIHQGQNDKRVVKAQSDALVARMRQLGLSVEYYVYQNEGHGFSRYENVKQVYQRIVAFLERHLR